MYKKLIGLGVVAVILFSVLPAYAMPPHPDLEANKAGTLVIPDHNLEIKDAPSGVDFTKVQKSANGVRNFKTLVILVDFSDKPAQVSPVFFDKLIFDNNPSDASPSVREFYQENSYNQLDLITVNMPSALGWQRASSTHAYYVNNSYGLGAYPNNSQRLMEELITMVDPYVNFADYDNDGDGNVDGVVIAHSGRGAELTGNLSDFWSHKWGLNGAKRKDNVWVQYYSIQPEFWNTSGDMTIGVYSHEIGHIFGLPDLYDTDNSSRGLGKWSLMSVGSWNGTLGSSPAHFDAWSKSRPKLGFVTPQVVQAAGSVQLPEVETTPTVYRINIGTSSTEYFLLENRQKIGYDVQLPGSGLLIWHVDDTKTNNTKEWYPGKTTTGNYWVGLEQADGFWELEKNLNQGNAGDPFPGTTEKRNFNPQTSPSSNGYNGSESSFQVGSISDSDSNLNMTALVYQGSQILVCGDLSGDGVINIVDVTAIIDYAFRGVSVPFGVNADVNADGVVSIFDVVEIINHAFRGYAAPDCLNTSPATASSIVAPPASPPALVSAPGSAVGSGIGFKIGLQVRTSDYLKVRVKPFGLVLATIAPNTRGEITGGSNIYQGYRWWRVKYSNGVEGWSADNWLQGAGSTGTGSGVSLPNQTGQ